MRGDFVVDDGHVVFVDDVDSKFLSKCKNRIYNGMRDTHDDVIRLELIRLAL